MKSIQQDIAGRGYSPYQGILRNAIINGDMRVAQRGTSFPGLLGSSTDYTLDLFGVAEVGDSVVTVTQESDAPASTPELQYSLKQEITTVDAAVAAGDTRAILHRIEGYNFAPFVGKTAILSFWVKAHKTGIYCVAFSNSGSDRSYVTEYTVNVADTWELKEIAVTFDYSGGTWDYTNGRGLNITWAIMTGSTFQTTADTWQTGNYTATANQVNGCDSTDNDFYLTGVQLHHDNGSGEALPFDPRPYAEELRLCQRYFKRYNIASGENVATGGWVTATNFDWGMSLPVTMRVAPTLTSSGSLNVSGSGTAVAVTSFLISQKVSVDRIGARSVTSAATQGDSGTIYANSGAVILDASAEL